MSTSEVWMGSGLTMTMAPESKLFLGYQNFGPTMGLATTKYANLIKYSVGFADDSVVQATTRFEDYYELVPDVYTGCTAEFHYHAPGGTNAYSNSDITLQFTATVAGNDRTNLYFAGNIADFPTLYGPQANATAELPNRGYIILRQHGAVIPAPISFESMGSVTRAGSSGTYTFDAGTATDAARYTIGDLIRDGSNGDILGQVCSISDDDITFETTTTGAFDASTAIDASAGSYKVSFSAAQGGLLTAGDFVAVDSTNHGRIVTLGKGNGNTTSDPEVAGETAIIHRGSGDTAPPSSGNVSRGKFFNFSSTGIALNYQRIISDQWLGLVDSATPSTSDITMEQKNMALGGSRNFTYQYKGMETAGAASLDVTLNQGTWLHYALGSTTLTVPSYTGSELAADGSNKFDMASDPDKNVTIFATNTGTTAAASDGPMFYRGVFCDGQTNYAICPPVLPGASGRLLTEPSVGTGDGLIDDPLTYTFTERNDSTLPSFAFELVAEKGGNVASIPQVDRGTTARQDSTTFDTKDTVYAQIHPGATMETMTLTAAADSAVTANMSFNVKRNFECPTGYVGRTYDARNPTLASNLPHALYNFGQLKGYYSAFASLTKQAPTQEFLTPFYFSDGTINLFGSEFMRVTNFSLTISNGLTDKRYIGQYNKEIKNVVTGQRTYQIEMTAQLTDRRLFAEMRNETAFRNAISHANVQLLLEKATGERIKLQFDDFMVSVANYPGPTDDRGPLEVSFTIMPIRKGTTIDAKTAWVLQG